MDYYSAIKNKGIIGFAGKWMELENILSEVSQIQKAMHVFTNKWLLAKKVKNTQDTIHRTQKS
jgi:mRNA deadenylase 3'-5' endonuclease subunit Ccr4